jgi:hypothetical protein
LTGDRAGGILNNARKRVRKPTSVLPCTPGFGVRFFVIEALAEGVMRPEDEEVDYNPGPAQPSEPITGAGPPTPVVSRGSEVDSMPPVLKHQILELEEWAKANKRDALRDGIGFWGLKIPAILASATAGVWAHFDLTAISVISGAIASICVIVDGIHPRGMLRNTHLRAFHDIRFLTTRMVAEWRSRKPRADGTSLARRIIRDGESERQRIANYIREAETALNFRNET